MKSKFDIKDNRPFSEKAKSFSQSMLFWRGRRKGMIHTRSIEWRDFRYIFFPKGFHEKYGYLGAIPWDESGPLFNAIYPLVLAMDYEAKPKWCPRWFLRFLDVFGNDKSIVRVRNRKLHNLHRKLTKGMLMYDYKTKWTYYDLRISIAAPSHLQDLSSAIEDRFYKTGYREELVERIKKIDPDLAKDISWKSLETLEDTIKRLENENENENETKD